MSETIVAIFDTPAHAALAAADLREAGLDDAAITVHGGHISPENTGRTAAVREPGFWASLFGGTPDHDVSVYEHSADNGASVIAVRTTAADAARVLEIVESHDPIDIDDRAIDLAQSPTAVVPTPEGGAEIIDQYAARVVNRGGSRVRRFVPEA